MAPPKSPSIGQPVRLVARRRQPAGSGPAAAVPVQPPPSNARPTGMLGGLPQRVSRFFTQTLNPCRRNAPLPPVPSVQKAMISGPFPTDLPIADLRQRVAAEARQKQPALHPSTAQKKPPAKPGKVLPSPLHPTHQAFPRRTNPAFQPLEGVIADREAIHNMNSVADYVSYGLHVADLSTCFTNDGPTVQPTAAHPQPVAMPQVLPMAFAPSSSRLRTMEALVQDTNGDDDESSSTSTLPLLATLLPRDGSILESMTPVDTYSLDGSIRAMSVATEQGIERESLDGEHDGEILSPLPTMTPPPSPGTLSRRRPSYDADSRSSLERPPLDSLLAPDFMAHAETGSVDGSIRPMSAASQQSLGQDSTGQAVPSPTPKTTPSHSPTPSILSSSTGTSRSETSSMTTEGYRASQESGRTTSSIQSRPSYTHDEDSVLLPDLRRHGHSTHYDAESERKRSASPPSPTPSTTSGLPSDPFRIVSRGPPMPSSSETSGGWDDSQPSEERGRPSSGHFGAQSPSMVSESAGSHSNVSWVLDQTAPAEDLGNLSDASDPSEY
jgi:hypothetical protein